MTLSYSGVRSKANVSCFTPVTLSAGIAQLVGSSPGGKDSRRPGPSRRGEWLRLLLGGRCLALLPFSVAKRFIGGIPPESTQHWLASLTVCSCSRHRLDIPHQIAGFRSGDGKKLERTSGALDFAKTPMSLTYMNSSDMHWHRRRPTDRPARRTHRAGGPAAPASAGPGQLVATDGVPVPDDDGGAAAGAEGGAAVGVVDIAGVDEAQPVAERDPPGPGQRVAGVWPERRSIL